MVEHEPAGFWIRLGATLLDGLIIGLPLALLGMMITGMPSEDEHLSDFLSFLYGLLTPILWGGYTVGKRICGIRITKTDGDPPGLGTMLMRNIVAGIVYGLTLGIGIIVSAIMVGVREDKRSLHDFIAGTEVIRD
ncbi:RDD family protein [Paenibacillus sambharensis]|uniref:RDD family protein n=1 Tax=Paenibacillus sambharensis TaxID=1803190 RepID=A0A2W1LFI4_9BACL|nr:RDD family protein [Paenibacillus sambharensis]PZD93194.1 RDD family protein [Paenibacillus sambharensis]